MVTAEEMVQDNWINNTEKFETQRLDKSYDCDFVKCILNNAREKLKVIESLSDSLKKGYELLLNNYSSGKLPNSVTHEFSSAVQIEDHTNECNNCAKIRRNNLTTEIQPDSQSEDLIKRYEKLLQENFAKELRDNNHEGRNKLELELQGANEQCIRLKKELTKTNELLIAEKMYRSKVEIERDSLACLLVEKSDRILSNYNQHSSSTDKMPTFSAVSIGNLTTELDEVVEYESDTDWKLELSPSPPRYIVNDEVADEIVEPDAVSSPSIKNGCPFSQEQSVLSTNIAVAIPSSPFSKSSTSVEQPQVESNLCNESFLKKTILREYLQTHRNNELPVQCKENAGPHFKIAENMEKSLFAKPATCNQCIYNTHIINNSPLDEKNSMSEKEMAQESCINVKEKLETPQSGEVERSKKVLQDGISKELRGCDRLELQLRKVNEQCRCVKTKLQAADEELTKSNELLSAEEMLGLKVEIEQDSLVCLLLKYDKKFSSADKTVESSKLLDVKFQSELDLKIEYESDTDRVLESSRPASITVVNDEVANKIIEPYGDLCNVEEPRLSANISVTSTSFSSPRINASAGDIENSLSAEAATCNQRTYSTRKSNEKTNLMKGNLPKKPKVQSAPIIKNLPSYQKDSNLRCDICGKYYASNGSLCHHKRYMHSGVKPTHNCSKCNKTFAQRAYLKQHESVHSSQRLFQCSNCNRCFKDVYQKNRHERIAHGDGGVYCAYCNKQFFGKQSLIHHITARHLPGLGKPYKCTTCGKSFIRKYELNAHQTVHVSERTHTCSICDKSFESRLYKLRHERQTHMEGFRFTCAHCERRFRSKGGLLYHIQRRHL